MSFQPLIDRLCSPTKASKIAACYFAPALAKKITHYYYQVLRTAKMSDETLEIAIFESCPPLWEDRFWK